VTRTVHALSFDSRRRPTSGSRTHAPRSGDVDLEIKFSTGECWLGQVLVATSDKGVCFLALGDESEPLLIDLQSRFPKARFVRGDAAFETLVARAVRCVEAPARDFELPLDVHGTAFQRRVWSALREVPTGETVSYAQIAARIGEPKAARAVAAACAANKIALAIPRHRVLRSDGSLSGYRWGVERKRALLDREARVKTPRCTAF